MGKKKYLIDTSVLLYDSEALFRFEDNDLIIPLVVVEELDAANRGIDELSKNARAVIRHLDEIRERCGLNGEQPIGNGLGGLKIEFNHQKGAGIPEYFDLKINDNRILSVLSYLSKNEKVPVILVTKDANLRIKAQALGLRAEDYRFARIELKNDENICLVNEDDIRLIDENKDSRRYYVRDLRKPVDYVYTLSKDGKPVIYKCVSRTTNGDKIVYEDIPVDRLTFLKPKNIEQRCAIDALMDPQIELVALRGQAGSGKSLLAIACGLELVLNQNKYQKLIVTKPLVPMGRDLGYIPGTLEEKLQPWVKSITDHVEFLLNTGKDKSKKHTIESLKKSELFEAFPLTYSRGCNIPGYIIVDEAQNLSPDEIKTIVSRAGEHSKVVLTGDTQQIDTKYLDSKSNGLSHVIDRFSGQALFKKIELNKTVRSKLADLAAQLL